MYKIISTIVFLLISVAINYFLLFKKNKKLFKIACICIVAVNIAFYLMDYFLFKNEWVDYIAFDILLSFLVSITFEDIDTRMIDTRVVIGYFILFVAYRCSFMNLDIIIEGLLGFGLSLAIMLVAYFAKKNSLGIGDVEAIAACGMIVGFPNIFHFLFKTFLFVFIYGLFLIITKKKDATKEIPLAPFLLLATIY